MIIPGFQQRIETFFEKRLHILTLSTWPFLLNEKDCIFFFSWDKYMTFTKQLWSISVVQSWILHKKDLVTLSADAVSWCQRKTYDKLTHPCQATLDKFLKVQRLPRKSPKSPLGNPCPFNKALSKNKCSQLTGILPGLTWDPWVFL